MAKFTIFLALILVLPTPARAFSICQVFRKLARAVGIRPGTYAGPVRWGKEAGASAEMEVGSLREAFSYVTVKSPDGTIREIVDAIPAANRPAWLAALAAKRGVTADRVQWEWLTFEQQKDLIEHAAEFSEAARSFFGAQIAPIPWVTEGGDLRKILDQFPRNQIGDWLWDFARARGMWPDDVKWADLHPLRQKELVLLAAAATKTKTKFYGPAKRSIPWLTWKDGSVQLADGQEVRIRDVFHPEIEFGSEQDARGRGKLTRLELHVKGGERDPVQTWQLAQALQKGMGFQPTPLHLHISFPLPEGFLAADPEIHSVAVTRQWALMNLMAEMEGRRAGLGDDSKADENGTLFYDSAEGGDLYRAVKWLRGLGKGEDKPVGTKLKVLDIGFRDWTTYQRPAGIDPKAPKLVGWEMRFLNPGIAKKFTELMLGRAGQIMVGQDFKMPGEANAGDHVREWKKQHPKDDLADAMARASYHWGSSFYQGENAARDVREHAPPELRNVLTSQLFYRLQDLSTRNRDVWMLTHDWEHYTEGLLLHEKPEFYRKLREAQAAALQQLGAAKMPFVGASDALIAGLRRDNDKLMDRVMLKFLRDSGIHDAIRRGAGLPAS